MRSSWLRLGLALAVGLVACGGGEDNASDDSGAAVSPTSESSTVTGTAESTLNSQPSATEASTSDTGGAAAGFHACDLLTAADVSEVTGMEEVAEGRDYLAPAAQATGCVWEQSAGGAVHLDVLATGARGYYDAVHFGVDGEQIEGLGDEAFWTDIDVLDVLDGDYMVSIQVIIPFSDIDDQAASRALAERALARLP